MVSTLSCWAMRSSILPTFSLTGPITGRPTGSVTLETTAITFTSTTARRGLGCSRTDHHQPAGGHRETAAGILTAVNADTGGVV